MGLGILHLPGIVLDDGLNYKKRINLSCNTSENADQGLKEKREGRRGGNERKTPEDAIGI